MAELKDILYSVKLISIEGERSLAISSLAFDSREVSDGCLFVAVKGLTVDGHDYIEIAIQNGAIAVLCEKMPEEKETGITYVQTDDTTQALGIVSANFYDHPSTKISLVGVTGTNGKTTTVTLLHDLYSRMGYLAGLISTVENKIGASVIPTKFTTPDALTLNQMLSEMVSAGCTHAFMEVSSHALIQGRVAGISFAGAVFSNISHDHLDYHGTFENYIQAKKLLFDGLSKDAFALVNLDDKRGTVMIQNCLATKHTYAVKSMADFKGKVLHNTIQGLELDIDSTSVWFKLIGSFNAYNLLAVYATAVLLGEEKTSVLTELSSLQPARGRFELVHNTKEVLAIVDYAHTPDALHNVLDTVENLRTRNEQLITVIGCGGDRDVTKRPEMARIAFDMSDKVILTSDNPRTENPEKIIEDMLTGIPEAGKRKTLRILDRKEAIRTACSLAGANDIILVAGKGHETYQEVNGVRHHFDDKEVLNELLNDV
ncbi:MAG: UDP-N-acetylmuramoyl-L-alanyl-D-glutamate--2,6-diaminopimelate ligase [Cyclobacteriaceae bacterium]